MAQTFLSYLILFGLENNLIISNSAGVSIFQREKMYTSFRFLSLLYLLAGIVLTSTISYFLNYFIYSKFDLYYISVTVNVFIVGIYNILISYIWKKGKSFNNYLYENSFSYAFDVVFTLSVIFCLDMSVSIVNFFMQLIACVIVVAITYTILGHFIKCENRGYLNVSFRNVPVRIFMFAIFSLILYYAGLLV